MSNVATIDQPTQQFAQGPARMPILAGSPPRAIVPSDFDSVWRLSVMIAHSGMAPSGIDTPEKIAVAVMHGLEIGLTPLAALQSIAVIGGRPSIWGDGAIALVRSSGLCEFVHETIDGDGDNRTARCETKRKGDPQSVVRTFSIRDAKTAKLWEKRGKNGNDTPWITNPDRMLQMRARAFALRDAFADVLKGLAIAEEQRDIAREPSSAPPVPPPPSPQEPPTIEGTAQTIAETKPQPAASSAQAEESSEQKSQGSTIPEEWNLSEYLTSIDQLLSKAQSNAELEAAWKGRPQPPRKLATKEIGELTAVLQKHKGRFAAPPPPPSDDATKTPTPDPALEEIARAQKAGLLKAAAGKPRVVPAEFNEIPSLQEAFLRAYDAKMAALEKESH